jgi:hypothetical protein
MRQGKLFGSNPAYVVLLPLLLSFLLLPCLEDNVPTNGDFAIGDDICDCHMPILTLTEGLHFSLSEMSSAHPDRSSSKIQFLAFSIFHPPRV